ncbi:MAG: GCN5-related N-acetyltransferase [Thermoleophilia bacterium]|nr:GCN5-related N-acetyltransferase [Thermoleophilia bacterium]
MGVPSPRVRCGPVELRLVTPRAAHQLFALARDPAVSRQLQWEPHASVDDSLTYIHDSLALWTSGRAWMPGIFDHEREQLVGCTSISGIDRTNRRAEVGTWIGTAFQGAGYNRPTKAALATFAFEHLELERLEFLTRVDNPRSVAAMRGVPGIREEGVLASRIRVGDEGHDAIMFALLAADWRAADWPDVQVDGASQGDDAG